MVKCSKCASELSGSGSKARVASISGQIMGDERTETYFFCDQCNVYSVEVYYDRFLGDEEASIRGPMAKAEGDARVELIRQCPEPWDKKCRCKAHLSYFQGALD